MSWKVLLLGLALTARAPAQPEIEPARGWVAESRHFRVVAEPDFDREKPAAAVEHLEAARKRLGNLGLHPAALSDEPLNVLLLPTIVDLQSLLASDYGFRTRGLTIHGIDRNLVVLAWHAPGDPLIALAHEYAHQLDDSDWPLWFREGRAEYLARLVPRDADDPASAQLAAARLERLRTAPLLGPQGLSGEPDGTYAAPDENFYSQAWLLFDWLAAQGQDVASLRPVDAMRLQGELGAEALKAELRRRLELRLAEFEDAGAMTTPGGEPAAAVTLRPAQAWEVPLSRAEVRYETRQLQRAVNELSALDRRYKNIARIQAALGAALAAQGELDAAERHLGAAVELGDARTRTAYRYALLLMRPGADPQQRAAAALRYALYAHNRIPGEPTHQLAVAQARMLTRDWDAAFEDLETLAAFPGWAGRAREEADQVRLRRSGRLSKVRQPRMPAASSPAESYRPQIASSQPLPTPPAVPKPRSTWPPPGTTLAYGRIGWVDCSGGERKIIFRTPRLRLVLREDLERPPKLIFPPFKWDVVPCESRGWEANIAYRRVRGEGEIKGEVVAIRF